MDDIILNISYEEYKILRRALENQYYMCKDEGEEEEMEKIIKLERRLIDANKGV
jgi:hypothetical protein